MPNSRKTASPERLTIVCISDTHELHREVEVPDGDILIHAGDFTMFSRSAAAIRDFNLWLGEQPHRHKIVIPGNHELFLESDLSKRRVISNAIVLIDKVIEVEGLKIWGSPTTALYSGALGLSSPTDRKRLYAQIPDDADILVTRSLPFGVLDRSSQTAEHAGCRELLEAATRVQPRLQVFGHVHGAPGMELRPTAHCSTPPATTPQTTKPTIRPSTPAVQTIHIQRQQPKLDGTKKAIDTFAILPPVASGGGCDRLFTILHCTDIPRHENLRRLRP